MNIDGFLPFTDFSLGLDLTSSPTGLDNRSLASALNVELTPQKGLTKRNGLKILEEGIQQDTKIMDLYNYYSSYGNYIISNLEEDTNNKLWLHDGADWIDLELTLSKKRMSFITYKNNCYCSNGTDDNIKIVNKTPYSVGIEPPATAPTLAEDAAGAITGKYAYVYVYKSSSFNLYSNPSPISNTIEVSDKKIKVSYAASTDPQVDKIEIYRTFALATGEEPVDFFLLQQ
jgi:hypothetical protein